MSRDLIRLFGGEVPALSYRVEKAAPRDGHMGCRVVRMHNAMVVLALGLLGALLGSVWLRRMELEFSGESPTMVIGLAVTFVSVLLILLAAT